MKAALIGLGGLLLAGFAGVAQAQAQGVPPGSYLQSCNDVHMERDRLIAVCRRVDGRFNRTVLDDPRRCRGIDNINGELRCAGGPPVVEPRGEFRERGERRERCEELRREAGELRRRLEHEFNPFEREQVERRLREVREQEERCR
jgi:hypothetical protein